MLSLYNSLTRQIAPFSSLQSKKVTLYVCGITPYDTTHLGHAFTYLAFDVLVRLLEYQGSTVTYTQNVTDINDRDNDILQRAQEQNVPWQELATFWTNQFLKDMEMLNWRKPNNYIKASESIPSMVSLMQQIVDHGFGYVVNGSVYLDITKRPDFGKLSHLSLSEMLPVAKEFEEDVDNKDKRHPLDITLWRSSPSNQPMHIPSFDSPWGKGRPGWHLECSSMAIHTLGQQIDIHGGGIDLIYPHHESEIAQSESATGKSPFASVWMHTGTVYMKGQKMAKSVGNLVLMKDLLTKYSPNTIRWVLLSHHYSKPWEYQESEFVSAQMFISQLERAMPTIVNSKVDQHLLRQQIEAIEDDLHVDIVLSFIKTQYRVTKQQATIIEVLSLLGFKFKK